jgi:cation diffusion facilitator family transporter
VLNTEYLKSASDLSESRQNQEYHDLYRFIFWLIGTSIPTTAMVITLGVLSGSLTIVAITIDYGLGLLLNIISLIILGIILRQNVFKYPYGTGKLENFAGFIYGLCIIPLALAVFIAAVKRYLNPPETIDLGLAQLFLLAVMRLAVFAAWITRLGKRYPDHSPLLRAYYVDYRASFINETAIFCGLLFGLVMANQGAMRFAVIIDMIIAALTALYLLYNGLRLIIKNFHSLIDLPLEEKFQYKILNCLTNEFESYTGIGNVYTRMSGTTRIVQIELYFEEKTTIKEIEELHKRVEKQLREEGDEVVFHLVPRQLLTNLNSK